MSYKIEAIILKSRDIKEYDRIYTVFSRELGKIEVLGVGVRKPTAKLASGLEPITRSEIFLIRGKWMDKATGVIISNQYPNIKTQEDKITAARRILHLVGDFCNEKEPNEEIYQMLCLYFGELDQKDKEKREILFLAIVWKMLSWLGYVPNISVCGLCKKKLREQGEFTFSSSLGVVCSDCLREKSRQNFERQLRISKNAVKALKIFQSEKIQIIEKLRIRDENIREIRKIISLILEETGQKKYYL